jgi:hypothetical protein
MTLDPLDIEHLTRETYAAHCILMNLGFKADDIFVATPVILNATPPGTHAAIILRPGPEQFVLWLAPVRGPDCERYIAAWKAFAASQPNVPRHELDRIVRRSDTYAHRRRIVTALVLRGIALPAVSN